MSSEEFKREATQLIDSYLKGQIPVLEVAVRFESLWNREPLDEPLPPDLKRALLRLFDVGALYSESPEERLRYPGYTDEEAVLNAAKAAFSALEGDQRLGHPPEKI